MPKDAYYILLKTSVQNILTVINYLHFLTLIDKQGNF